MRLTAVNLWLIAAGATVVGVILLLSYLFKDKVASKALKAARGGDLDGGLALIRAKIAADGPSADRGNALGEILWMRGDPSAALSVLEDAAARLRATRWTLAAIVSDLHDEIVCNRARALSLLGRGDEAFPLVAARLRKNDQYFRARAEVVIALCASGRVEEANEQYHILDRQADELEGITLNSDQRARLRREAYRWLREDSATGGEG